MSTAISRGDSALAERIRLLVDSAPPLTPETLERVTALFRAGSK
jgi:hypothetical protein